MLETLNVVKKKQDPEENGVIMDFHIVNSYSDNVEPECPKMAVQENNR